METNTQIKQIFNCFIDFQKRASFSKSWLPEDLWYKSKSIDKWLLNYSSIKEYRALFYLLVYYHSMKLDTNVPAKVMY